MQLWDHSKDMVISFMSNNIVLTAKFKSKKAKKQKP